ncbi:MAG: F0F1 ATP synthase subunit gamma [Paludibacteraceae bacterium]
MSSLKEIKTRIASVSSTMKITSAMKMVASAKLHKAQKNSETFLPYQRKLEMILRNFLSTETTFTSPYAEQREIRRVAIVAVSSNSSLCGAFNANIIRELDKTLEHYRAFDHDHLLIFPIGRKVYDACRKRGLNVENLGHYIDNPQYAEAAELADRLMTLFVEKKVDKVELIYQHSKSTSTQQVLHTDFLPIVLETGNDTDSTDYIVEPSKTALLDELLPKVLRLKMYALLLDSYAAEQAARTIAMQVATDNANDLLQQLTIQYNKSRQQAITNELLDIIGGAQQ